MQLDAHTPGRDDGHASVPRLYAWSVFALTFGLMLSDYLTRNVMSAVFPFLKAEWTLSDKELGSMVSVVALVVGFGSFPLALVADRWGRVKSITAMAGVWCLATIGCGLSTGYTQMMVARGFVGLGEAGYGSAGGAILSHVFPPQQRAAILGAFLAAALFGSVLGVALGGVIATHFGWRTAFIGVGMASMALVVVYPMVVRDYRTVALVKHDAGADGPGRRMSIVEIIRELLAGRCAIFTYLGSGLQMFVPGVINAWMPSYLVRYYDMAPDQAAIQAAIIALVGGVGMIGGGVLADRAGRRDGRNKLRVPAVYSVLTFLLLIVAFVLPPGFMQRTLILAGVLLSAAHAGAATAVITDVTHPGLRATALAVVTLGNNLLGFAPGPFFVGVMSDAFGLRVALAAATAMSLAAAFCFIQGSRHYEKDRGRFEEPGGENETAPAPAFGAH